MILGPNGAGNKTRHGFLVWRVSYSEITSVPTTFNSLIKSCLFG